MDYGRTNSIPEQDFFTRGQGTNIEAINNNEPENNLDLSNNAASWGKPIDRDPRSIGSSVSSVGNIGDISSIMVILRLSH